MSENEKKETATEDVVASANSEAKASEVAVDSEAEKREGTKEMAVNSDVMAIEGAKAEPPEKECLPSFFVKKSDRHRVEVDVLSSTRDGKMMSVSRVGLGLNFQKEFPYLKHSKVWFEFSLPNYEDMSTYRQRSASWKREAQQVVVDKLALRNFLLVWHLKDWSLADEDGNKVVLEQEESGALTDESVAKVYAVSPTLVDVVLTLLEKDILVS